MQTHKRGDTWSTVGQATIKDLTTGELVDLTDWQIASELRKPDGTLIAAFACTYTGTTTVAAAVRAELATELARIDAPTTSRLADAAYTAPDNATALQTKQIAIEIQTRVDAALGAPN